MIKTWLTIYNLFSRKEKRRFYLLLLSAVVLSLLDIAGFASAMPFVAVAINPEIIQTNAQIHQVYVWLGFTDTQSFLVFLGLTAFVLLIFVKGLYLLDMKFALRFWYEREYTLSKQLLQHYLNQNYAFFLKRNSAELNKTILAETHRAVHYVLMASVELLASITGTLFLLIVLVIVDPMVAFATLVFFGGTYIVIFLLINRRLKYLGEAHVIHEAEMFKRITEAFEGVKEIKLLGKEKYYRDRFTEPKHAATRNITKYDFLTYFPPNILESIAFGGIIMVTVYFTIYADNTGYALSLVALYAFSAYRILPYLKSIFDGFESLQYNAASISQLIKDFPTSIKETEGHAASNKKLIPKHLIELRDVSYRYPGSKEDALKSLNLQIKANSTSCFFGQSGTGKTTTIDIILGLLIPDEGELRIDNQTVSKLNIRAWQNSIGHVSHNLFLTDDSVSENIAFGIAKKEIDQTKVIKAAKTARIHAFITDQLDQGYDTVIGEKGSRLSAGQRQRICIARALYRDSEVLVFDEATSALDKLTEHAIMDTLLELKEKKTIIFISHKPAVAELCDNVILLDKGKFLAQGTYQHLVESNAHFRKMVKQK